MDPQDPFMAACQQVVLVDDELTTGNTALRLIRQLHKAYGIRRFTLMALVDNSDGGRNLGLKSEWYPFCTDTFAVFRRELFLPFP